MNRPTTEWISGKSWHIQILVSISTLLCIIGLLCVAGCLGTSSPMETTSPIVLTASGAPALSSVLETAGINATEQFPGLTLQVMRSSSEQGIKDLISEKTTIALTSRAPTSREYSQAKIQGKNLHLTLIAYDPLKVVVHPANPITSISREQLAGIFSNRTITDWSAFSAGQSGPLHPYLDSTGESDIRDRIQSITGVNSTHPVNLSADSAVRAVAADLDGIACIYGSALTSSVKMVTIEGNGEGGKGGVKAGTAEPLYLVTDNAPSPAVLQVISELFSGNSTATMKAAGLVPVV